ncbi:hypothetical protein GL4_0134 [Methyloceanibacter caenitepidi]|uniref:Uncharacterized protein n=1 Tax=Methyloceanibacter caenitepidi TaxID=1384459 RepID=A0A0A8K0S5_9HYPH|nr:hypothetical protein GL4_0134 [Methyloceanibacter caenitepidi]
MRDETGGFRQIVRNVFPHTHRVLVKAASEADQIAGVGQALQID